MPSLAPIINISSDNQKLGRCPAQAAASVFIMVCHKTVTRDRLASETVIRCQVKFKLRYVWLYFRDDSDVSLDVYNPSPILVKALKKLNKITMSNIFT